MIETIRNGSPSTSFLRFGDKVKIEMIDENQNSIFGSIEQTVEKA
jgi:fumarylacetoacetate (FAA) hydrolase